MVAAFKPKKNVIKTREKKEHLSLNKYNQI